MSLSAGTVARRTSAVRCVRRVRRHLATHVPATAPSPEKDCSSITPPYSALIQKLERVREGLKRPLTLAEKILYSHLYDPEKTLANGGIDRGNSYLLLSPERVAMQDASAQCVICHQLFCITTNVLINLLEWHCKSSYNFLLSSYAKKLSRLQFMSAGLPRSAVPTSIHCDHLIQASEGADLDLQVRMRL
jgi:homoaconitase